MADLGYFIERMRYWCNDADLGYDQSNRWDFENGGECDCSSLVIHCLQEAGFDTGAASYTGNMSSELCARGWARVANDGCPQPGDILLNDCDHTAVWLGDCLAQASYDENCGASGGMGGDQTGWETNTTGYYNFPWDCYLRWTGGGPGPTPPSPGGEGNYVCTSPIGVNVRTAPSTGSDIVATYSQGDTVYINSFTDNEGIHWGVYTGASGNTRYIAVVNQDGSWNFQPC